MSRRNLAEHRRDREPGEVKHLVIGEFPNLEEEEKPRIKKRRKQRKIKGNYRKYLLDKWKKEAKYNF